MKKSCSMVSNEFNFTCNETEIMSAHVLLNHQQHLDLHIIDNHSEALGDGLNHAMVFPIEFRDVQSYYPIFFKKHSDTGQFYAASLFGFENNENLFLKDGKWDAAYLPMMSQNQPFFIGLKEDKEAVDGKALMVTLDMDSPRISKTEGQALFNKDGSPTEFLNKKMSLLERLHQGNEHSALFNKALVEHELLESLTLEITLADGSKNQLLGLYTIKEKAVQSLSAETLEKFSKAGFLMPIVMVLASHTCLRTLIDRKNIKTLNATA